MKYVDRIPRRRPRPTHRRRIAAEVQPDRQLQLHGVLRRPHPRHLALRRGRPAAAAGAHDPRPGLPGVRAAHRPRRPGHRAGAGTPGDPRGTYGDCPRLCTCRPGPAETCRCSRPRPAAPTCAWSIRRPTRWGWRASPDREVVFLAIGFETTTPPTALVIKQAAALEPRNFSVLCNHVLTPSGDHPHPGERPRCASSARAARRLHRPGACVHHHRLHPYEFFAEEYRKPVVIAGFEPLDVMQAILMLVRQVNEGRAEVENEFTRAVTREGNLRRRPWWRGVRAAPQLRVARPGRGALQRAAHPPAFATFDAERRFELPTPRCPTTRPASAAPSCAA
jgi:hypothetical protein